MTGIATRAHKIRHPKSFFIGGDWVSPSSTDTIDVIDSGTEEVFVTVAEAQAADIDRAVKAAREAFDRGPWPRMSPAERAVYLNRIADLWPARAEALADSWSAESGVLRSMSTYAAGGVGKTFRY